MKSSVKILASEVLDRNARLADMDRVLRMVLQLAQSGGHDGENPDCPTCHVVSEIERVLLI